ISAFQHFRLRGRKPRPTNRSATLFRMDELLDILDEAGRPTGQVVAKSEAHRLGLWHRCFHCWICGSDPEGPYLLLQRRAAPKEPAPPEGGGRGHLPARPRRRRSTLRDGVRARPGIRERRSLDNANTPRGARPEGRRPPGPGRTSGPSSPVREPSYPHLLTDKRGPKGQAC